MEMSREVGNGVRKSCKSFGREREEGLKILRESGLSFVFSFCVWFQSISFDFLGKHKN